MNFSSAPEALDPVDSSAPAKRHRRWRKKYGRFYLLGLFAWMRVADLFFVVCFFLKMTAYQKQQFLGPMVAAATWTTILLAAIALRQQWARYVLAGGLFFAVVFAWSTLPGLPDALHPGKLLRMVVWATVTYLPVAVVLVASRNIQKLTDKEQL